MRRKLIFRAEFSDEVWKANPSGAIAEGRMITIDQATEQAREAGGVLDETSVWLTDVTSRVIKAENGEEFCLVATHWEAWAFFAEPRAGTFSPTG